MPASESGERRATNDRVPDWFAKLVIAAMATCGLGIGGWALLQTFQHEGRIIKIETKQDGVDQFIKEIRQDVKEIKDALAKKGGA